MGDASACTPGCEGPVLIVGADGLIGRALKARLESEGVPTVGTTRRRDVVDDSCLFLDLAGDVGSWECPRPVGVAVLCAAVVKLADCERDPIGSRRVNVEASATLARLLAASGVFVVYLSTNQVFDGTRPLPKPTDPVSPLTQYGRQKVEVEQQVLSLANPGAVVRLTKVLQPGFPLFRRWVEALSAGAQIQPFSDMVMAPVPLAFVAEVLARVVASRFSGILQVSAERDLTYAEAAQHIARRLGVDPGLVRPRSCTEAGLAAGTAPRSTALDIERLNRELQLQPPDVWWTIDSSLFS
jgi:dTDP-4-dehydrorhamnose reductase